MWPLPPGIRPLAPTKAVADAALRYGIAAVGAAVAVAAAAASAAAAAAAACCSPSGKKTTETRVFLGVFWI